MRALSLLFPTVRPAWVFVILWMVAATFAEAAPAPTPNLFLAAPGATATIPVPTAVPATTPAARAVAPASAPAVGLAPAAAPSGGSPLSINMNLGGNEPAEMSTAIQILLFMTVLSLAPAIAMLMTSFTRIVIVLGFVRTALGVQSAPSNQIIVGLSLFLTLFIMAPVANRINSEALQPYSAKQITFEEASRRASMPLRQFMLKQTRPGEVEFFLGLAGSQPTAVDDLSLTVVIPAFVVSELRTAFQMGFLVFIPFMVIDFLVASTLMAMGMMMMPPTVVSLPFKLLLFVLVDGWHLVIRSLVQSFGII